MLKGQNEVLHSFYFDPGSRPPDGPKQKRLPLPGPFRHRNEPNRRDDIYYDPINYFSSEKSFLKHGKDSIEKQDINRLVPNYDNQFSSVPYCYPPIDGVVRQSKYCAQNINTSYKRPVHIGMEIEKAEVTGKNRALYFARGNPQPLEEAKRPSRVMSKILREQKYRRNMRQRGFFRFNDTTKVCNSTQTVFRESEAQTQAYTPEVSPEWKTAGDERSEELLKIAFMTTKNGWLPPNINAVEFVE